MISVTEIILIIAGVLAVILGYLIPSGRENGEEDFAVSEQKISEMVGRAIKNSQGKIDDMLDDCMEDAINKAERAMDRVTNEKMSAISEYSDTVMNDIHRNHDEVMFMYDMLNDKHKNLKNTVSEVDRAAKEVKQTAKEAVETVEQAEEAARHLNEQKHEPGHEQKNEKSGGFSSLTDILDRADAAAYEKTNNKIISSVVTEEKKNPEIFGVVSPEVTPQVSFENVAAAGTEDVIEEGYLDEAPEAPEAKKKETSVPIISEEEIASMLEEPAVSENPESQAKVVSITEASKKKIQSAAEEMAADNANDPASRNQRILDMHKAGKSAVVIARELRLGIGEVKLVIDLAGKHKKNRSSII